MEDKHLEAFPAAQRAAPSFRQVWGHVSPGGERPQGVRSALSKKFYPCQSRKFPEAPARQWEAVFPAWRELAPEQSPLPWVLVLTVVAGESWASRCHSSWPGSNREVTGSALSWESGRSCSNLSPSQLAV